MSVLRPSPALFLLGPFLSLLSGLAALAECLAPMAPERVKDPTTRSEYHAEIAEEYLTYFDEAQAYLRCIDETRAAAIADVNEALADYQTLEMGTKN